MDQKLKDFLTTYNSENKALRMLDTEIQQNEFGVLSGYFDKVALFIDDMGLSNAQMGDVKNLASQDNQMAMLRCFKYWKSLKPANATYRTLLKVVLKVGKEDIAKKVLQHMIDNDVYKEVQPVELREVNIN